MQRLRVHHEKRYLIHDDGRPFFYLADTAWELFHRLTREEIDFYMQTRARQRFTMIQAVVLAEFDGLNTPNACGHRPLVDNDPARPNEAYFEHVDYAVDRAAAAGLVMGMLPTWGDKVVGMWGAGPEIFTPETAGIYGEFLGRRYRDKPIIWILGGDRPIQNQLHLDTWRAMAAGLRRGDGGNHLITFHPAGRHSSSDWVHNEPWLDFNMIQSGHQGKNFPNYQMLQHDYALLPPKPILDGEPNYEDHPVMSLKWTWQPGDAWFDDYDVRKSAWRGVLAGACGHTYGCHDIWQMWEPGRPVHNNVRTPWRDALELPGANQMRHLRALWESRNPLVRRPDNGMLHMTRHQHQPAHHMLALSATDGSHAFIYSPLGDPFRVHLSRIHGRARATWFDPRTGESQPIGAFEQDADPDFTPPTSGEGNDWVLVLDRDE